MSDQAGERLPALPAGGGRMRRGRAGSLAASPTLVGAVTVLITSSPSSSPTRPTRACPSSRPTSSPRELPNANTLVPGNEVRIGGIRVGQINDDRAGRPQRRRLASHAAGRHGAEPGPRAAARGLDRDRPLRSALGPQVPGDQPRQLRARASRPARRSRSRRRRPEPVEIDQVFNTFDDPTRAAIQVNLTEFGNALAGRGAT